MKNKLLASLLLSGTVLSLVNGASAAVTAKPTTQESATQTSQTATSNSQAASGLETKDKTQTGNDRIQTLKEQTMVIRKVITKDSANNKDNGTTNATSTTSAKDATATSSSSSSAKVDNTGAMGNLTGTAAKTDTESSSAAASGSSSAILGINKDDLKGVNNSKFTVYDVTDLMQTIIKEKLKTDGKSASDQQIDQAIQTAEAQEDQKAANGSKASEAMATKATESSTSESKAVSKGSESSSSATSSSSAKENKNDDESLVKMVQELRQNDTLRKEIETRAAKLNKDQMKKVADVTTTRDEALKADGVARVKLPIDGKYHAYYVVNTETPASEHATNSAPIVVITPVTDDSGQYAPEFTVYPKSDTVPDQPSTTTEKKLFQTGRESFWDRVINWFENLVD